MDTTVSDKQQAAQAVAALPDTATFEDVIERLVLLSNIQRGLDDVRAGRTVDHDEMVREAQQWRG